MRVNRTAVATGAGVGSGWLALLADKLLAYLSPDSVATLQAQYSETLKILAASCAQ